MRVLHINDHLALKGGVEVYVLSLATELERHGVEVGIAFGQGDETAWRRSFSVPLVSSVALGSRRPGREAMRQVLASFAPDVCQVHSVFNPGVIEACLDHGPTVLHLHDYRYLCPSSGLYYRRQQRICERTCSVACFPIGLFRGCQTIRMPAGLSFFKRVRFVEENAHRFHAVLANSQYVADRFQRNAGEVPRLRVFHYFCPIDPAEAPPESSGDSILFLGRVRELKGIIPFLEVLRRLPDRITGTIVGDPDAAMRALIDSESRRLGVRERVKMTGWVGREEVAAIMGQASAVVFPSLWAEPFGIVGMEALARGVPVVSFDVGGVRDWLEDGVNGFLVPPNDPGLMASKLERLLEDPELRRRFGQSGILKVKSEFDREEHVKSLLACYGG